MGRDSGLRGKDFNKGILAQMIGASITIPWHQVFLTGEARLRCLAIERFTHSIKRTSDAPPAASPQKTHDFEQRIAIMASTIVIDVDEMTRDRVILRTQSACAVLFRMQNLPTSKACEGKAREP
jgi:hypothetical protein